MAVNLVVYIFNNFVLKDLRKTFLKEPQKKKKKKKKAEKQTNIWWESVISYSKRFTFTCMCPACM